MGKDDKRKKTRGPIDKYVTGAPDETPKKVGLFGNLSKKLSPTSLSAYLAGKSKMAGSTSKQSTTQLSTPSPLKRNTSVRSPPTDETDTKKSKGDRDADESEGSTDEEGSEQNDDIKDPLYIPPGQSHGLPSNLRPPLKHSTSVSNVGSTASCDSAQPAVMPQIGSVPS